MNVSIRPVEITDAAAIARIYAQYVIGTAVTFDETPPDAAAMTARVEEISGRYPYYIAETTDGVVIGYAYAVAHRPRESYRWSVDVTIYLDGDRRRGGVGTALYNTLLPDLARRGFVTAYAGITLPNFASVGLHERLGFSLVGVYKNVGYKLGRWHDVGWWERRLSPDLPSHPPEPRWMT